jgi:hypothetical protein
MSMIGIDAEETAAELEAHAEFAGADLLRELEAENVRLRKVIAHLMTNPLDTRQHTCCTSDIDYQTGQVEITDGPDDRTTIRITEQ